MHQEKGNNSETKKGTIDYLSPDELHKNPAYSQAVVTEGQVRTVYVGGQNAVNQAGEVVGKGDIQMQATQILGNIKAVLKAGGAELSNVIKWNVYVLHGQNIQSAFEVFQKELKSIPHPPLVTVVQVPAFVNPDFLLEIDAIAVVAQ
jgi:enamine deaminase RidA (YjgF/YER057c/UK114 family)